MQAHYLLGPAGSGKTHRCLAEIRAELLASPEGLPLILLAPKQATFQLERQLLADPSLPGYTRLQILSFERLADMVLAQLQQPPPQLLSAEGRVMVLRALLGQKQSELKVFRASARLPGFARQLSSLLRELQQYHLTATQLESLAARVGAANRLDAKLHDLALILRAYLDWLKRNHLEDADRLPGLAAEALPSPISHLPSPILAAGLWLDGFAEMTPLELDLLAALVPRCERATLAFCLESEPKEDPSWLSTWSVVGQTFRRCYHSLAATPGCEISVEVLPRDPERNRFAGNPALQHLEQFWANPQPFSQIAPHDGLRLAVCPNPEAEAVVAAREILRFVRGGRRFRDCAVLLRNLEGHHDVLRRVFTRYEIPFFLDRREPVAHHPLAELTRFALRTVLFGWKPEDWFGALKTGLLPISESEIDRLETEALARGWQGKIWQEPLTIPDDAVLQKRLETLRLNIGPTFDHLAATLASVQHQPTGIQLAEALRQLWQILQVETTLDRWSRGLPDDADLPTARRPSSLTNPVHSTVWQQMNEWLDNLALAFPSEALPLRDWLPILEAGLSGMTVGVVPPALDQVLIGAIDRSRNPDLHLAIVIGVNESLFPAPPARGVLLTDADRAALENQKVFLGPNSRQRLGHERYYGYIACTRARQRVVITCAATDAAGQLLNPSAFLAHLQRLFPGLECENIPVSRDWRESEHASELVAPILRNQRSRFKDPCLTRLAELPVFTPVLEHWNQLEAARAATQLSPGVAQKLYGVELQTSVSGLEDFAACPFKFFVSRGLRAEERKLFEVDQREKGSFQHAVLSQFHRQLDAEGKRWRDLTPGEARQRIGRIGEELLPAFHGGIFPASEAGRFTARTLIEGLQRLIEILIGWMPQYEFDPQAVELGFGLPGSLLPGWRLDLGGGRALLLRGRIDRVDLFRLGNAGEALAVVMDYKASARKLDAVKLHHGLELQLLAYLSVLRRLPDANEDFQVSRLLPAGVFYVNLKGASGSGSSRTEVLAGRAETRRGGYQHLGRFDAQALRNFDNRPAARKGDQFKYSIKADGELGARGTEAMGPGALDKLLGDVENHLRRIGQEIHSGNVAVSPYRKNQETACDHCDYRPICRFDPWTDPYRVLRPPPKEDRTSSGARGSAQGQTTI